MKVSELIKITNKKMDKLKSQLFSMLIIITILFGIGILGTLFYSALKGWLYRLF